MSAIGAAQVKRVCDLAPDSIAALCERYCIALTWLAAAEPMTDSYWGAPEAGISHCGITLRADTPVHSWLHELCHIVCMSAARRSRFSRNAGGSALEECAVCYLQVLLAQRLPEFSAARCLADMDAWGYSFREGSAAAWFEGDGRDARDWLLTHGLIDAQSQPTFRKRK